MRTTLLPGIGFSILMVVMSAAPSHPPHQTAQPISYRSVFGVQRMSSIQVVSFASGRLFFFA